MIFIVGVYSENAAMLVEGFHSIADSVKQIMLLIGHKRANRPPDEKHPFRYGKELYLLFAVGFVPLITVANILVGSAIIIAKNFGTSQP